MLRLWPRSPGGNYWERMCPMSLPINVPELFGTDVFNEATMQQRLAPEVYSAWKQCVVNGSSLPLIKIIYFGPSSCSAGSAFCIDYYR